MKGRCTGVIKGRPRSSREHVQRSCRTSPDSPTESPTSNQRKHPEHVLKQFPTVELKRHKKLIRIRSHACLVCRKLGKKAALVRRACAPKRMQKTRSAFLRRALTCKAWARFRPLMEKELRFRAGEPLESFQEFSSTVVPSQAAEPAAGSSPSSSVCQERREAPVPAGILGLRAWLHDLSLGLYEQRARDWAEAMGAVSLEEFVEHRSVLAEALSLKPLEVLRLDRRGAEAAEAVLAAQRAVPAPPAPAAYQAWMHLPLAASPRAALVAVDAPPPDFGGPLLSRRAAAYGCGRCRFAAIGCSWCNPSKLERYLVRMITADSHPRWDQLKRNVGSMTLPRADCEAVWSRVLDSWRAARGSADQLLESHNTSEDIPEWLQELGSQVLQRAGVGVSMPRTTKDRRRQAAQVGWAKRRRCVQSSALRERHPAQAPAAPPEVAPRAAELLDAQAKPKRCWRWRPGTLSPSLSLVVPRRGTCPNKRAGGNSAGSRQKALPPLTMDTESKLEVEYPADSLGGEASGEGAQGS